MLSGYFDFANKIIFKKIWGWGVVMGCAPLQDNEN